MSRNPLTPEPRTDKNGVTRVRWVNPFRKHNQTAAAIIPAPAAPEPVLTFSPEETTSAERLQLQNELTELLVPSPHVDFDPQLLAAIADIDDDEYLKRLVELATIFHDPDAKYNPNQFALKGCIRDQNRSILETAYSYRELLREQPGMMRRVCALHMQMSTDGDIYPASDGRIPNMAEHLYVCYNLNDTEGNTVQYRYGRSDYAKIVAKHADKVPELMEYFQERGSRGFTDEAFEQYLRHGALRDGML
jgi:hypothetical protein